LVCPFTTDHAQVVSDRDDQKREAVKKIGCSITNAADCFKKMTVFVILLLIDYSPLRCQKE